MYKVKTHVEDRDVLDFIESVPNPRRREEARRLLEIFSETTQMTPRMWGETMIGFGQYHYRYASGHEGDAMMLGFSPRKAKISLYLAIYTKEGEELLEALGKTTHGKVCVYVNKMEDIQEEILKKLIEYTVAYMEEHYDVVKD